MKNLPLSLLNIENMVTRNSTFSLAVACNLVLKIPPFDTVWVAYFPKSKHINDKRKGDKVLQELSQCQENLHPLYRYVCMLHWLGFWPPWSSYGDPIQGYHRATLPEIVGPTHQEVREHAYAAAIPGLKFVQNQIHTILQPSAPNIPFASFVGIWYVFGEFGSGFFEIGIENVPPSSIRSSATSKIYQSGNLYHFLSDSHILRWKDTTDMSSVL